MKNAGYLLVAIGLGFGLAITLSFGFLTDVNNFFETQFAFLTDQVLSLDQVAFFVDSFYPFSSEIPITVYQQVLQNNFQPQVNSITYYILNASQTPTAIVYLSSPIAYQSPLSQYFSTNLSTLIYANNPSNLNSTYILYPIYLVHYTGNCSNISSQAIQSISLAQESPMANFSSYCNATSSWLDFYALVGTSNSTATFIDAIFSLANSSYSAGDLASIQSPVPGLNGTILGFVAVPQNSTLIIKDRNNYDKAVPPIRNIWQGDYLNGSAFIGNYYCWDAGNNAETSLILQSNYSKIGHLFYYNNKQYLCLDVANTNSFLDAYISLDASNITIRGVRLLTGYRNISNWYDDWLLASQIGAKVDFIFINNSIAIPSNVSIEPPLSIMPNTTYLLTFNPAPPYIYSKIYTSQFYESSFFPIFGEPDYLLVSAQAGDQQIYTFPYSVSTYIYYPLASNLTYQMQFNQTKTGYLTYCTDVCSVGRSLVYQDFAYRYQVWNADFGYVFLPERNQTLWYTPYFTIVAQTPVLYNNNSYSQHYMQYCFYTGSPYTCEYGLSPRQMFEKGKATLFVIYQRFNPNQRWVVNGQIVEGWENFINYLKEISNSTQFVQISMLNPNGDAYYTVYGRIRSIQIPFVLVEPTSYNIYYDSFPPARVLAINLTNVLLFFIITALLPIFAYYIAKAKHL